MRPCARVHLPRSGAHGRRCGCACACALGTGSRFGAYGAWTWAACGHKDTDIRTKATDNRTKGTNITRGAGGGRRVRRRVGWLKDRGARRVDKRKPISWVTESQRCGFLLRAHRAGCGADREESERLGGADNKALTDAGLGTVLSDSLRSLNLSNCSRSVSGIHRLHGHASAHSQRAVASGRVTGRVT